MGCTVTAEVSNGVWVGQEPSWESPINRGSHCAKGAATRELVHGDRRLRYPMKLVNGQWTKISWDVAINEIGDKMNEIRAKSGARVGLLARLGQFTNEGAYLPGDTQYCNEILQQCVSSYCFKHQFSRNGEYAHLQAAPATNVYQLKK